MRPATTPKFDCFLCIREVNMAQVFHLGCGHQFCHDCWSQYLATEMQKGPRVVLTRCIDHKCTKVVPPSIFNKFLPFKHRTKFQEHLLHSFVSGHSELSWCPGKDCVNAGRADVGTPVTIECSCQHLWCFACRENAHLPCNCELARMWMDLARTDSENLVYVRAYTKQCPKCKNHIEKNQGCNHMTLSWTERVLCFVAVRLRRCMHCTRSVSLCVYALSAVWVRTASCWLWCACVRRCRLPAAGCLSVRSTLAVTL